MRSKIELGAEHMQLEHPGIFNLDFFFFIVTRRLVQQQVEKKCNITIASSSVPVPSLILGWVMSAFGRGPSYFSLVLSHFLFSHPYF